MTILAVLVEEHLSYMWAGANWKTESPVHRSDLGFHISGTVEPYI